MYYKVQVLRRAAMTFGMTFIGGVLVASVVMAIAAFFAGLGAWVAIEDLDTALGFVEADLSDQRRGYAPGARFGRGGVFGYSLPLPLEVTKHLIILVSCIVVPVAIVTLGVYSALQSRELHLSEPFIWGIGWGMIIGPVPIMIGSVVKTIKPFGELIVTIVLLVKEWREWRKGTPSSRPY
jgi:hypothetical protein